MPRGALRRLCVLLSLPASTFVERSRTPIQVILDARTPAEIDRFIGEALPFDNGPCRECGGTGQYVELNAVEVCGSCSQSGEL